MTMTESTPQTAPSAPPVTPAPAIELLVSMTDAAAAKVQELRSREGKTDAALRLFVKSGGCSGYSYGLAFDDKIADDDRVEDHAGVPIVIDAFSVQHVAGAEIDYVDSLMGSGFAINNPNAVSSCSCGQSFNTDGSPRQGGRLPLVLSSAAQKPRLTNRGFFVSCRLRLLRRVVHPSVSLEIGLP